MFVIHEGGMVLVYQEVLDELKLRNGQTVSTPVFWQIIKLNASLGLAKIAMERGKNG